MLANAQLQAEEETRRSVSEPLGVSFDINEVRIRAENLRVGPPPRQARKEERWLGVSDFSICAL